MSYHEYTVSREIAAQDYPFYALIMAAMRKADTTSQAKLRCAWPEVWGELEARYHLPGGLTPSEVFAETQADRINDPGVVWDDDADVAMQDAVDAEIRLISGEETSP